MPPLSSWKKNNSKLRLMLDCTRAHEFFKPPPGLDMGAGDCLQQLELKESDSLWVAQADVANCLQVLVAGVAPGVLRGPGYVRAAGARRGSEPLLSQTTASCPTTW